MGSFADAGDPKYGQPFEVPLSLATEESLKGLVVLVPDIDKEEVVHVPWPTSGWRKLVPGTGYVDQVVLKFIEFAWMGNVCKVRSISARSPFEDICGLHPDVSPSNRTHVLFRSVNYHPDRQQTFHPSHGDPYVAAFAKPGDDIKLEDIKAFYFDGSCGMRIPSGVWHSVLFPVRDYSVFYLKEGRNNALIEMDTVKEFGKFLSTKMSLDN